MSQRRLVAGVDSSTQATKVVVIDADTGEVAGAGRAGHDVAGTGGARESDPGQWWDALADALAQTGHAGDVAAIAVGGQQHGLVVLGEGERPLRPAMLWNDTRAAPEAAELVRQWGADRWAGEVGVVPVASFTASICVLARDQFVAGTSRISTIRTTWILPDTFAVYRPPTWTSFSFKGHLR